MTNSPICRDDPRHALPVPLPREFRRHNTAPAHLGAHGPGQLGLLELEFARRDGVSRLVHHYQQSPLQIVQPHYPDPARPDMPYILLVQLGGGMLGGDRYRLDITCREGAAAHVTTQSAAKLYKCEENVITQMITITAEAGSVVEYLPDLTIPFRHSRYFGRTDLRLDPDATVIVGEILTPGRVAHGERHAYDIYLTQTDAFDLGGRLLAADTIALEPGLAPPSHPALLGPYDVLGTLSVFSRRLPPSELTTVLRDALASDPQSDACTMTGVSELPNDCGVSMRILGKHGSTVERARTVAWNAARVALLGVPAPAMRKG